VATARLRPARSSSREDAGVHIVRVALGAVANRGASVVPPALVTLAGPAEADFLGRHVMKVRSNGQARSTFVPGAAVPGLLAGLAAAADAQYAAGADALQQMLARAMGQSTNASDCVTAVVHAQDTQGASDHITVLKLDANVEAARRDILQGVVSLTVLSDLLPTPRDLQKALSWPDPRPDSDALMIDANAANAQYFENAYQVQVSPKSAEAEAELQAAIVAGVPQRDLARALQDASRLDGRADVVLTALAQQHPSLGPAAQQAAAAARPAGIVRRNKIAARPVVWRADGVELKVPADRAGDVEVTPDGNGYVLSVRVDSRPQPGV
jgi:hypothetical protein